MKRLTDRVVLITGAASGIGKAVAQRCLDEGAFVMGFSFEDHCDIVDPHFGYVSGNVASVLDCQKSVQSAVERFGKLDGLVHCAGITREGNLETTPFEVFKETIETNVVGTFAMCQAAIPELKKQPSTIVNISSNMAIKPIPGRVAYNPSKAAVNMMTECIAIDYAPIVRANTVMPGIIDTPMIQRRLATVSDPQALLKQYAALYPMQRIGQVDDIVNAVIFLSCDESSWITGIHLPVCGGDR